MSERIFKMYSPLTGELYQAGEYEYDDSADEYNGEELLLYAKEIDKAVKAYTDNGTEDLMKYFYESDYVKQHVRSLVPSVEVWNRRLWGCTTVRADDDLSEPGWDKLMDYLAGQYSDGWGEGFEQREIETEDGLLYVLPVTWITRNECSGWPSTSSMRFIRSRSRFVVLCSGGRRMMSRSTSRMDSLLRFGCSKDMLISTSFARQWFRYAILMVVLSYADGNIRSAGRRRVIATPIAGTMTA